MMLLNKNSDRFFQCALLLIMLGLGIGLYTYWPVIVSQIVVWQKEFHDLLATHVNAVSQDPIYHGISLIALSFAYGVFHAIGPGHGKAIVVAYLGSHKESLLRGAAISWLAALFQSVVAILLVVILSKVLSIKFSEVNRYTNDMTHVSYVLVMLLGGFLFLTALFSQWKHIKQFAHKHNHQHDEHKHHHDSHHHDTHLHEEEHSHSCCGGHHVDPSDLKKSWLQSVSVIFSMGIRPCTGAILVLIYAHLVGAFFYGVLATLVMGLGTGLAVAALALGTQLARNWFEKLVKPSSDQSLFRINSGVWLRMIGGGVIFLLGLSLFQAAMQISNGHPLI